MPRERRGWLRFWVVGVLRCGVEERFEAILDRFSGFPSWVLIGGSLFWIADVSIVGRSAFWTTVQIFTFCVSYKYCTSSFVDCEGRQSSVVTTGTYDDTKPELPQNLTRLTFVTCLILCNSMSNVSFYYSTVQYVWYQVPVQYKYRIIRRYLCR